MVDLLPPELLLTILDYLPGHQLPSICLVSRQLAGICRDESTWTIKLKRDFNVDPIQVWGSVQKQYLSELNTLYSHYRSCLVTKSDKPPLGLRSTFGYHMPMDKLSKQNLRDLLLDRLCMDLLPIVNYPIEIVCKGPWSYSYGYRINFSSRRRLGSRECQDDYICSQRKMGEPGLSTMIKQGRVMSLSMAVDLMSSLLDSGYGILRNENEKVRLSVLDRMVRVGIAQVTSSLAHPIISTPLEFATPN